MKSVMKRKINLENMQYKSAIVGKATAVYIKDLMSISALLNRNSKRSVMLFNY